MMAMDYARDQETAQMCYDYMKGNLLPDPKLTARMKDLHKQQQRHGMKMPGEKEKTPRLFQSVKTMPLKDAFAHLGCPKDWLDDFQDDGEHYAEIRKMWR